MLDFELFLGSYRSNKGEHLWILPGGNKQDFLLLFKEGEGLGGWIINIQRQIVQIKDHLREGWLQINRVVVDSTEPTEQNIFHILQGQYKLSSGPTLMVPIAYQGNGDFSTSSFLGEKFGFHIDSEGTQVQRNSDKFVKYSDLT